MKMSSERLQIIRLVERSDEPLSPAAIAAALGKASGATRELLSKMHRDGQLSTRGRGRYVVASGDVTDDVAGTLMSARMSLTTSNPA